LASGGDRQTNNIEKRKKKTVDPCALNPGYGILITTLKGSIEADGYFKGDRRHLAGSLKEWKENVKNENKKRINQPRKT
jgi:hypothetical protein